MTHPTTIDGIELAPPAEGRLLPAKVFTSPHLFERELTDVFGRSWVHIADTAELVEPGSFVAGHIGRVPVVAVRGHDGELRTFLNACRHRGATLASGNGNCGKQLKCPYHAWSFGTDGRLIGVPFRDEFDVAVLTDMNLVEIRTAVLGPMVFGCLDAGAPPFEQWAGELVDALARARADEMVPAYEFEYDIPVNWKVYVENGLEGYHIAIVHDVLDSLIEQRQAEHVFEDYSSYTHAPLTEMLRNMAPAPPHLSAEDASRVRFGFVFPNLVPVITPGELSYLRIDPVGPEQIRLRARSFDLGDETGRQLLDFRRESFDRTNRQDIEVVTRVQAGHRAGLPPGVHSSKLECRIGHFERLLMRTLAR